MPVVAPPYAFSAIHALGVELSQQENSCWLQKKQFPQAMLNGTTTRSPTLILSLLNPDPTSSTTPMNSCPRMSPFCIVGMYPSYRCRSDPQMQVEVMRTIASRGLRILGSGTLSTLTEYLPHQVTAFMGAPNSGEPRSHEEHEAIVPSSSIPQPITVLQVEGVMGSLRALRD